MPAPRPAPTEERALNHLTTLSLPAVIRDPGIQLDLMGSIPFYSINGSPVEERGIDDTNSDDCDFFLMGANNTI
jgi:hypothetical protein